MVMFKNKTTDNTNKDDKGLNYYLDKTKGYKSDYPEFNIKQVDGFNIIDESVLGVGAKSRMSDFYISNLKHKELVYVAPRVGYAALSLAHLCKKHNKNLTLVIPASKEVSDHQALAIEYGATPLFLRVAGMKNANRAASMYADATGAHFIPFGLDTEDVYAGAVTEFQKLRKYNIKRLWCVISTGVLSRSLQIALPDTEIFNVAVARNIQQGELGRAHFQSYHKGFTSKADTIPPFDSVLTYDAKGWEYLKEHGQEGDWFFNVAGPAPLPTISKELIHSYRDWNDNSDFGNILD